MVENPETGNPYDPPSTAADLSATDAPTVNSGVTPIETSTITFVVSLVFLVILPATNIVPLGKDVLPPFLMLPSPSRIGAICYITLCPVGALALAVSVGFIHYTARHPFHRPLLRRLIGWVFLTASFVLGLFGALTVFGG